MSFLYVAAAVAAVGAIAAGKANQNAMEYQAEVQDQQAMLSRRNAGAQEEQQRRQARAFQGRQLAAVGESGVALTGSTADIFRESLYSQEMDALNIRYEGELGNASARNAATASRYNGKTARQASYFSAASSLIGGVSGSYANANKPKTTGTLNG